MSMLCTAGVPASALAQSDIFVCVDEQGRKTYQNVGAPKGCKKVDVQPILTVPAPKLPARPNSSPSANESRAVTPASFPRVDGETQRSRDNDRRRILEEELRVEQDKLTRLRAEYNNGEPERRGDETRNFARYQERVQRLQEEIQRSENNVASLQRELALLRQ
ncbi:DUF4124 domain-containing protein [Betaproteobacteria bacterium PRO7]|nr:DUF4124 domain-containing protein [Betaproteobacteria bacterium PRO7]